MIAASLLTAGMVAAGMVAADAAPIGAPPSGTATMSIAAAQIYIARAPTAGVLALANAIRSRGCDGRRGVGPPLRRQARLDAAAERLAAGAALAQATDSVGYRAASSVSLQISGDLSDEAIARMLASRFCAQLTDAALRDIGFYEHGDHLWILAAAPFAAPELSNPVEATERALALVNQARAAGRRCGNRVFAPAAPLSPSARLRAAALEHSRDMAAHSYLDHAGSDGSTPAMRVARAGYAWRAVGENVAAGLASAQEAVAGWLASPAHCANVMDPDFTETGIAYAIAPSSRMGVYWTEVFAAPLRRSKSRAHH